MRKLSGFLLALLASLSFLHAAGPKPLPDDPAATAEDRAFIKRAYELAVDAEKKGNPPFGALFVVDGKVVGEASNKTATSHDPTKQAEMIVISLISPRLEHSELRRGVLYTSSEPGIMSAGAILNAGITKVVYGTSESQIQLFISPRKDKKPLTFREIIARTYPAIKIVGPVLEKEGLAQHAAYWPEAMKKWHKH